MASERRKNPINKKKLIKILIIAAVIIIAIIVLLFVLRSKVAEEYGDTGAEEVLNEEITVGSISTTVSGSGTLQNEDSNEITIPQSVEVTDIYVEAGDTVVEGDMLASVNTVSVVQTMSDIQADIDELDEKLSELTETETSETISSGVAGRIKAIYAGVGTPVADTMYENQALMLVSMDGYMAVDLETDALNTNDTVTVTASDGTEYSGTVDSVWAGNTTITITDNGTTLGDEVSVKVGEETFKGSLYIHEQVAVTGYSGTVSSINVSLNESVSEGTSLITLTDVDGSVNYQNVLEKRDALVEEMQNLITIYKEGAVYAKTSGIVTSITESDESGTTTVTANTSSFGMGGGGNTVTTTEDEESDTIIAIAPTDTMSMVVSVDETDILSLSVGQEAVVTVDALDDQTFTGTITEIDKVGSSTNGVTSYSASIVIERTEDMLDGMSASAVVTIEGRENALLSPAAAVHNTSSTAYVYTSYDETTGEFGDMVEVTVGISNGQYTEIISGLSEGDVVYYTEEEEGFSMGDFGGGNMPGGFDGGSFPSDIGGGNMPGGNGGNMNGGGSMNGGGMPDRN